MTRAVVIGSGPNGLAAAIRLAEAGLDVTVFEAADAPGGAVRSQELTLPGFVHDTFSAVHPAGAASPVFGTMLLERFGLEWVHPEACAALPLPRGEAAVLYRSLEKTSESLEALCPGDGEAWEKFAQPLLDDFESVRAAMLSGFPPLRGWSALPRIALLLPQSSSGLGKRLFAGHGARGWLDAAARHGDAAVTAPGSAIAGVWLSLMGHGVGWPSPRGGAQRLTDALAGYLESMRG